MKIANIGSSFSAGPGIYPQAEPKAGRSESNFAHILAKHLNAELVDLSISGATLSTMLREPQIANGHKFPPQIEGLPADVDLVLMLGGGNDMHYITNIIAETWIGWLMMQPMKLLGAGNGPDSAPANENEVYQRYGELLDAIHARAPQARVIVVEYLTLFGSDAMQSSDPPCTRQRMEYHQTIAAKLQEATNKAVTERQSWCEVLPTARLSESHGLGSQDSWVFGLDVATLVRREAWAHPNAKGMQAVADLLIESVA